MSTSPADQLDVTVHYFTHGFTSTSSLTSEAFILKQGRALLVQATAGKTEDWHSRQPVRLPLKTTHPGFMYMHEPPQIEGARRVKLKEWGTPADGDEIFRLSDLPEFSSTDFTSSRTRPLTRSVSPPDGIPPAKKRKIEHPSLHQLIPQPHFLPSPVQVPKRQPNIPSYKKSKQILIPPYKPPLDELTEWDRCAWLIPIRGKLPWPESTSGVLLNSSRITPYPSSPEANEITWTQTAISQFWSFLLELRRAGSLGPLSLSFHPAPPSHQDSDKLTKYTETNVSHASVPFVSLSAVDYIKIYHDWPRTLHLRTILDAWSFETNERKIRLLVGAKLALLDDNSRGIMIL